MVNVILHETPVANWHALLNEAQSVCETLLSEEIESYLVFLLVRFTRHTRLADKNIAIDFLSHVNLSHRHSRQSLQAVGDKCLLCAGLFPELSEKHLGQSRYLIDIGQSAYDRLSMHHLALDQSLFSQLSEHFLPMRDVLNTLRTTPMTEEIYLN